MASDKSIIWAHLIHLSINMWADRASQEWSNEFSYLQAQPHLRFDMDFWHELVPKMVDAGINMVVFDIGDAIKYESHPEISVEGALSIARFREELNRLRDVGIEPIPKLNFSACHDMWLGKYSRMLSTDIYYNVCRDLIAEVIDIFDKPRFFHLGMDEETYGHQRIYEYVVVRQYDLWWHDFLFLVKEVEKAGVRAWIWSDYVWEHPELFWERMPKSVLQSNWYYGEDFSVDHPYVKAYLDLEEHGYDQIPTGSNWTSPLNFERTVRFAKRRIAPERLKGFLQTTWKPTLPEYRERHLSAIEQVAAARRVFERK